jgi:asparagine synthase (glutamine-hydrolysing)
MAGLVGIYGKGVSGDDRWLSDAVKSTVYSSNTVVKNLFADQNINLWKSYMTFIEGEKMEAQRERVHVWIDGEVYNQHELQKGKPFAETVLDHYLKDSLDDLLKKVDGIYVALIYDLRKQEVHLITDRYGLKVFYISVMNNHLMLAPELKCFPFFPPFKVDIRKDVVDCFVQLEHMMGTATWFAGVEVTAPATVYSYSLATNTLAQRKYWSWSTIDRVSKTLEDASEELGFLLENAIRLRKVSAGRVGVGLSGGFDSRAILAAIREDKPPTYTFGIEESADVRIAKEVATLAGVSNIHFDMHVDRWLEKRFSGIWKTDGMLNMYHMHYSHLMNEIPKVMDVNLSGFLGDGVLGSTYVNKKGKKFLNKRIDVATAQHYYGKHYLFSNPSDSFFDIPKVDAYLIYNRGRRLTGLGMEEANKTIYQRIPFMDNKLMDFSYSLPDELRDNSKMYHRALLLKYPEFYSAIPHATSGMPIQLNPGLLYKTEKLYHRWLWVLKFKLGVATSFTDVYNWVKVPETAKFIRETLDPKNALYPNFTQSNFLEMYFEPHLSGKGNFVKQVMSSLTMEIWLQQIFNKKFLSQQ